MIYCPGTRIGIAMCMKTVNYIIHKIKEHEYPILDDFLYETIFEYK